jgi:hypothetical protein
MTAHGADQICVWAAILVPPALIVLYRWIGLVLGVVAVWGILAFAGVWISSLDPTRDGGVIDSMVINSIWLLFGWIGGLMYCVPIFGVRELVAYVVRRRRARGAGG